MTAGDVGTQLQIPCNISLTGATVTMTVVDPYNNKTSLPMNIGSTILTLPDGSTVAANFWAYRTTLATDFPNAGNYALQLVANFGGGSQILSSTPISLTVGPKL